MANYDGTNRNRPPPIRLSRIITKIHPHLDTDIIIPHMLQEGCLPPEDYDRISKIRYHGTRLQLCTDIIMLIEKQQTLESFKTALQNSSQDARAHEDILKAIREEELKHNSQRDRSFSETDVVDRDRPHRPGRVSQTEVIHSLPILQPIAETVPDTPPAQPTANDAAAQQEEEKPSSLSSFVLGSLCVVLSFMVVALAGFGLALMVLAGQGAAGMYNCTIKVVDTGMTDPNFNRPNPEQGAIFAFNFISGFLCLVLPAILVLLMVNAVCNEFAGRGYNKQLAWKILWIVIISYLAVSTVIAAGQLGLSFYIAYLIFSALESFVETIDPGNEAVSPVAKFDCDPHVYLSAFISLILMYLVIFILLALFVVWMIGNRVQSAVKYIQDYGIAMCLQSMCKENANGDQPPAANATEGASDHELLQHTEDSVV